MTRIYHFPQTVDKLFLQMMTSGYGIRAIDIMITFGTNKCVADVVQHASGKRMKTFFRKRNNVVQRSSISRRRVTGQFLCRHMAKVEKGGGGDYMKRMNVGTAAFSRLFEQCNHSRYMGCKVVSFCVVPPCLGMYTVRLKLGKHIDNTYNPSTPFFSSHLVASRD